MPASLFYAFATLTLVSAVVVAGARNPVGNALGMILVLIGVAANFFLLEAPFLGSLLVLVYAGAVMVLFLFVIMLLDVEKLSQRPFSLRAVLFGAGVFVLFSGATCLLLWSPGVLPSPELASAPTFPGAEAAGAFATGAKAYGQSLWGKYMLPLQLTGFLLLAAIIGVVSLSRPRARPAKLPTQQKP
ncbi:MAG: NADH-quinone oxidoreductase subunit J [Puniceicoccales bacterium]|nr:NADH-quinone oxidoreductase subunit J [Puniceicoccales bacterium]